MTTGIVFSTPWFELEAVAHAGETYYRLNGADGVICLPMTPEGDLIMVRQFRPALGSDTLEFPAGGIDRGESPHAAVIRELREETGHACRRLVPLGPTKVATQRISQSEHFFVGLGATPLSGWQPERGLTVEVVTRDALRRLIVDGRYLQSPAVYGIVALELRYGIDFWNDPPERIAALTA